MTVTHGKRMWRFGDIPECGVLSDIPEEGLTKPRGETNM